MKEEEKDTNLPLKVAILLFDGVELLDFAGPGEVFSITKGFKVYTVGLEKTEVISQRFLTLIPTYSIEECPTPDILVIPGGELEYLLDHQPLLNWLRALSIKARHILSVCTGAALLAKAGLLHQREATTLADYKDRLQELAPTAQILTNARLTDNGQLLTTAGISAGIDGALYLLARLKGKQTAKHTADYMEYAGWNPNRAF